MSHELITTIEVIKTQLDGFGKNQERLIQDMNILKNMLNQEMKVIRDDFRSDVTEQTKSNEFKLKELELQMQQALREAKSDIYKELDRKADISEYKNVAKIVYGLVTVFLLGVANELFNLI
jgi:hypothetical protein